MIAMREPGPVESKEESVRAGLRRVSSRIFIYFIQKGDDASRCFVRLLASTGHIGSLRKEDGKRASVGLRGLPAVLQTAGRCA